jgi:hypothetical protein
MFRSWFQGASAPCVLLASCLTVAGCAAPPNQEIGDAQKALKAAQAAGAEEYARKTYDLAAESYRRANQAVLDGEYRLALSKALESREYSQQAIRQASDLNVRTREQVHQQLTDVAQLLADTALRIESAGRAGASARVVADARRTMTRVTADLQKAIAALGSEEFVKARPILDGIKGRLQKTLAALDAATPQSSKRRP